MKTFALFASLALISAPALALTINVSGFSRNTTIPSAYAYCTANGPGKTKPGGNRNPEIRWNDAPAGTKSFALIVVDKDVPASFDDANRDNRTIPVDAPRRDFYHWVLINIPARINFIAEGADSQMATNTGKPALETTYGRNGQNDFATIMNGPFGGYDGPCPPWNDLRVHNYHFQLYALDVANLNLGNGFNGKQAMEAITPHIIAQNEWIGTFSNYIPK